MESPSEYQRLILSTLEKSPNLHCTRQIARTTGLPYNSYFRAQFAALVKSGQIIKVGTGYFILPQAIDHLRLDD